MNKKAFLGYLLTFFIAIIIFSNVNAIYINEDGENIDFDQKIEELMKTAHMPSLTGCIVKNNDTSAKNTR